MNEEIVLKAKEEADIILNDIEYWKSNCTAVSIIDIIKAVEIKYGISIKVSKLDLAKIKPEYKSKAFALIADNNKFDIVLNSRIYARKAYHRYYVLCALATIVYNDGNPLNVVVNKIKLDYKYFLMNNFSKRETFIHIFSMSLTIPKQALEKVIICENKPEIFNTSQKIYNLISQMYGYKEERKFL